MVIVQKPCSGKDASDGIGFVKEMCPEVERKLFYLEFCLLFSYAEVSRGHATPFLFQPRVACGMLCCVLSETDLV